MAVSSRLPASTQQFHPTAEGSLCSFFFSVVTKKMLLNPQHVTIFAADVAQLDGHKTLGGPTALNAAITLRVCVLQ